MANILVTGCAGFIGSHVCERLLAGGHHVTGIDNFSDFYSRHIKESNMHGFSQSENFVFHEVDILNVPLMNSLASSKPDIVVHLAARAGVRPSIADPKSYADVNITGTQNILEMMRAAGCCKLFFASSSSIYGNQKEVPFKEDAPQDKPISPYAFTKRAAELLNHTYHHLYHFDIINARFFTVYGPRQRPDLAIHKFARMIANDEPIEMYGNGDTARDYTYIDDTVSGVVKGIEYLLKNENVFETINLGNHHPVDLKTLIEKIYLHAGKPPHVKQLPMQQGDVEITYADISRAGALLDYHPATSIDEGLKKFFDWFKAQSHS